MEQIMGDYMDDLPVEEQITAPQMTADRWAKQFRMREFGEDIPDVMNGWWYKTLNGYLPHQIDESLGIGNTRAFLFTGPEGSGRYSTALALAGKLHNNSYRCYSVTGDAFDAWKGSSMETALQALAVGQAESGQGDSMEGRTVIIRYPEECRRAGRLMKALLSVLMYCKEMDLPLFLIVISNTPSKMSILLRREMTPCVFRLPDSEARLRFFKTYYEGKNFRFDLNGNAAIEKERREKIVSLTEGFNYTQLHRITELVFIAIKDKTLEKNVYVLEDTLQAFEAMEYIFLEPAELEEIVERIRDEKTMEAAAPAVIAAAPVMYNGAMPAAGAVSAGNPSAMTDPDGSAQDYLQSRNKKKQVSLAEMYKTITSELG